jgi:raffinose/stachyose/melibiose transport system permease protein
LFLIVYLYYPFIQNIINSFLSISGLGTKAAGVNTPWYTNYVELWNDPSMRTAVKNTLLLVLCTLVFQVGTALVLALIVDRIKVGQKFFRTAVLFPDRDQRDRAGTALQPHLSLQRRHAQPTLQNLGITQPQTSTEERKALFFTMLLPILWQYVGFYFVILVTGLNNISTDVYEAAELDGATGWKRVRFITLPLLRNVICTCLILAVTGALKVFDLPWVMMGAGIPLDQSWLTGTYMYNQTFTRGNVDYGSAIAVIIVVLGVLLAQVANRVFKEKEF